MRKQTQYENMIEIFMANQQKVLEKAWAIKTGSEWVHYDIKSLESQVAFQRKFFIKNKK